MRILKYLLLLLLLLSVAFVVFVATLKSDFSIVRSKEIKISKDIVYNFATDSSALVDWNPWYNDVAAFENIKLVTGDTLIQSFLVKGKKNESLMEFQNTKEGTLVSWELNGTLDFNLKLLSVLQGGVDHVLGDKLEEGLNKIDSYLIKEISTYNIKINGLVTKNATNFIQQKDTCKFSDFQKVSKSMLQNMMAFVKKNNIIVTGSPFITHYSWNNKTKTTIFSICVPVEEEILTTDGSEISGGHFDAFLAMKTTLTGDYSHNKEAWNTTLAHIKKKNLVEDLNGDKIEVYKISLPKERKPSKWLTEIYIPVKKRVFIAKPEVLLEENITPSENKTITTEE